jgi:hypothetical protein
VFAHANRFIRASMALEAVFDDAPAIVERDALLAFGKRVDAHLAAVADSLRHGAAPPTERLRNAWRTLAEKIDASRTDENTDVANAIVDASDRMTDSVDSLAYVLRQRRHATAGRDEAPAKT